MNTGKSGGETGSLALTSRPLAGATICGSASPEAKPAQPYGSSSASCDRPVAEFRGWRRGALPVLAFPAPAPSRRRRGGWHAAGDEQADFRAVRDHQVLHRRGDQSAPPCRLPPPSARGSAPAGRRRRYRAAAGSPWRPPSPACCAERQVADHRPVPGFPHRQHGIRLSAHLDPFLARGELRVRRAPGRHPACRRRWW